LQRQRSVGVLRIERLNLRALINGLPPSLRGGGSSRTVVSCAPARLPAVARAALEMSPMLASRRVIMVRILVADRRSANYCGGMAHQPDLRQVTGDPASGLDLDQ
jgi:hypothetical protein